MVLAVLGLSVWVAGRWRWGTLGAGYVPMSPSAALAIVLLSGSALVRSLWPDRPAALVLATAAAILVVSFSVAVLADPAVHLAPAIERAMGGDGASDPGIPVGRMSPMTAAVLLLAGAAGFLAFPPLSRRRGTRPAVALCAFTATLAGLVVTTGYAVGAPLLYGTGLAPMALSTALCLVLLGVALLLAAGPEEWPLRLFSGAATAAPRPRFGVLLVGVHLAAIATGGLAASHYLAQQGATVFSDAKNNLAAVADLKVRQIADWRAGLARRAEAFRRAAFAPGDLSAYLADPAGEQARQHVEGILTWILASVGAERAVLLDAGLSPRLAVPTSGHEDEAASDRDLAAEAMRTREVQVSDLQRSADGGGSRLALAVPVSEPSPSASEDAPFAAVVLEVDPRRDVFPAVRTWPTTSPTSEALLLRREGDQVVLLSEPRSRDAAALPIRLSTREATRTEAMAVRGEVGAAEGVDYRGVPVLAALRAVPGTPWSLVAKVDRTEVLAEVQRQAWLVLLLIGLGTVFLWSGAELASRRREAFLLRNQVEDERDRASATERAAHLMRSANDAILLTDETGRIVEANDRAIALYGRSPSDLLRRPLADLCTPEAAVAGRRELERLAENGSAVFETTLACGDGAALPAEVSARMVEIGGARFGLAIVHDLTRRKVQERAIERLSRLYATLSHVNQAIVRAPPRDELLPAVCGLLVRHGGMRFAWIGRYDAAAAAVMPVARAEAPADLAGRPPPRADGVPEGATLAAEAVRDDRPAVSRRLDAVSSTAPETASAGPPTPGSCVALPLHLGGVPWGALVVGSEDTEFAGDVEVGPLTEVASDLSFALEQAARQERRLRSEDERRDSERRYQALFERAAEGILVADVETHRLLHANPSGCRMFGYTEEEMLRLGVFDLHPAAAREDVLSSFGADARGDGRLTPAAPCVRKDGSAFLANVMGAPVRFGGRDCVVRFFTDVTHETHLEARLRQSMKMEAVGNLAGGIAHDFNNLLPVINAYGQILLQNAGEDGPGAPLLRQIVAAGERAAGLTRQLLVFSRREIVQPVVLDVGEVVENVLKMLQRTIPENVEIVVSCAPDPCRVRADPTQMEQVILNLSINARDAMPDGGRLSVAVRAALPGEGTPAPAIETPPGGWVLLSVADTGVGMDAVTRGHLFEPFFTTKKHGTGLGLATVFGIVGHAGGHVAVESEPGHGSTFTVFLPKVDAEAGAATEPVPAAPSRGTETVLLVEDNPDVREVCRTALVAHGYAVLVASDPQDAIRIAASRPIAVLLTDVVMPGMDGPLLAERIRSIRPEARVLLMSGYTENTAAATRLIAAGAGYIQKPFTGPALASRVRGVLNRAPSPT